MIKVANLTKRFGGVTVLDNLSFEVKRGEIVGFLGPNGAGKTTTMRILSCYLPPTGGTVTIDGLDVLKNSLEVRRRIGYLPENVPIYHDMRVIEYLRYRSRLKGLSGRKMRSRIEEVISRCGLGDVRRAIIGVLSKGYRQRVGLADALVHDPEVLILDEPTIGLDPNQIRHIRSLIRSLAQRHTVLLSTHILPEVEMVCERVLIINKGKIVASDTADNLVGLIKGNLQVVVEVQGPDDAILDALKAVKGVVGVLHESAGEWSRFTWSCDSGTDVRSELFRLIADKKWVLRELKVEKRNLEDVFVSMTMKETDW
jgi:ABC-2 type transport system ATP-binding protein